jgi:predicted nucleic acid-binding protein
MLDTDVASLAHKRSLPAPLAAHLASTIPVLSFVAVSELAKWTAARDWGQRRRDDLERWISSSSVIWCDDPIARVWGRLAAEADRRGRPRPQNDTWVAACCLVEGLPLATRNVKDYADFVEHHGLVLVTDQRGSRPG